jgi:hypothetical protein
MGLELYLKGSKLPVLNLPAGRLDKGLLCRGQSCSYICIFEIDQLISLLSRSTSVGASELHPP